MWTLAFDTTTNFCSIILKKDDTVQSCFVSEMTFGQSEVLIPQIDDILKTNKTTPSDLNLLGVCVGPGSFTGVRSSIAAARSFALCLPNLSVCGISAFDVYAHSIPDDQRSEQIAVIIETKREDFYVAYYDKQLKKISSPKTAFYTDIIADLRNKSVTFAGDGAERFLSKPSGLHIHSVNFETHPNVETLADLAITRFHDKKLDFPKPLYLKAADVCIK